MRLNLRIDAQPATLEAGQTETEDRGLSPEVQRTAVLWVTNLSHATNHFQNQMVSTLYPVIMAELGFGYLEREPGLGRYRDLAGAEPDAGDTDARVLALHSASQLQSCPGGSVADGPLQTQDAHPAENLCWASQWRVSLRPVR